jgi:CheY-like chemotaxis protein
VQPGAAVTAIDVQTLGVHINRALEDIGLSQRCYSAMVADGAPSVRVLLVDDEADIRRLYAVVLSEGGYEVRDAANGAEALVIAQQWRPDVILLDLMMPVMNGWQFMDAYGALPDQGTKKAAVVVITAAGPGAVRSTTSMGTISAVLSKPVDVDVLLEVVGYHTAERRRLH